MKKNIFLIVLMIAAAAVFYNPFGAVNPQMSKFVFYISALIIFFTGKNRCPLARIRDFPINSYKMVLIGMFGACIMASLFQKQTIMTSIIAMAPYFFGYFSLIVFIRSGLTESQIIKIIFGMLAISLFIYLVNMITFPNMIFGSADGENIDDSRGMVRIGVTYVELYMFMQLYSVNEWMKTKKSKWLVVTAVCTVMIVFSLTRQVILLSFLFTGAFVLRKLAWYKKIFFLGIVVLVAVFIVPEIPIYKAMVEVSEQQKEMSSERDDPRVRCFKFYTDTYQTNAVTRIFGNGIPSIGNSEWGNQFEIKTRAEGAYSSDLGWVGFYWHFGLPAALGVFLVLLQSALLKKNRDYVYLSYFSTSMIFLAVLSSPILIYRQVINIMLIVYLTYVSQNKLTICRK